jgi:hypothetical protein
MTTFYDMQGDSSQWEDCPHRVLNDTRMGDCMEIRRNPSYKQKCRRSFENKVRRLLSRNELPTSRNTDFQTCNRIGKWKIVMNDGILTEERSFQICERCRDYVQLSLSSTVDRFDELLTEYSNLLSGLTELMETLFPDEEFTFPKLSYPTLLREFDIFIPSSQREMNALKKIAKVISFMPSHLHGIEGLIELYGKNVFLDAFKEQMNGENSVLTALHFTKLSLESRA